MITAVRVMTANASHVITVQEIFVKTATVKIVNHVTVKMSIIPAVAAVEMVATVMNVIVKTATVTAKIACHVIAKSVNVVNVKNVVHVIANQHHAVDRHVLPLLPVKHHKQATMGLIMR